MKAIKAAAANYQPEYNFGWREDFANAQSLRELADDWGIILYHSTVGGNGVEVIPILSHTYRSGVLKAIAEAVAPFMDAGEIEGGAGGGEHFKVVFKGGRVKFGKSAQ